MIWLNTVRRMGIISGIWKSCFPIPLIVMSTGETIRKIISLILLILICPFVHLLISLLISQLVCQLVCEILHLLVGLCSAIHLSICLCSYFLCLLLIACSPWPINCITNNLKQQQLTYHLLPPKV